MCSEKKKENSTEKMRVDKIIQDAQPWERKTKTFIKKWESFSGWCGSVVEC